MRCGKRTVKDGEALAVWDEHGVHTEYIGPALVQLWMSTIRFLDRFVARADEYLVVTDTNGRVEHVKGPTAMFCNPTRHKSIELKKAVVLASPNECLVVYTKKKSTDVPSALMVPSHAKKNVNDESKVEVEVEEYAAAAGAASAIHTDDEPKEVLRRVVAGPAIFIPRVDEWTHEFRWTSVKTQEPIKFSILQTGCSRYDTKVSLRTADSVLLAAKLSIQFKVASVEAVLEGCDDPIAVMQSLLCADLSAFGTLIRSDDMLTSESRNKITTQLGDMETYRKLIYGARSMGLEIVSLCLKKLDASSELQRQYDYAIQTKAELTSKRAVAEQKQQLADLELSHQKRRMESEQALASAQLAHKLKMLNDEHQMQVEHQRMANEEVLNFLKELKTHEVDLTRYLVSFSGQKATIKHLNKAKTFAHMTVPLPPPVQTPPGLDY